MSTETGLSPVHPGEILREEFLVPMKITPHGLAEAIGVDTGQIHSIVRAERPITEMTALLLGIFFDNSPSFWMGLQSQHDLEVTQDALEN